MPGAFGGQKKGSDPLELESQVVVNCPVGARNFARAAKALNCRSASPALGLPFSVVAGDSASGSCACRASASTL